LGDPRAFEPLTELLDDDQPLVRYNAASALGKLGDMRAVGHLAYHLGGPSFLRESAIKALRKLVAIHRTVRLPRL
jgi:HEAT repeat protein